LAGERGLAAGKRPVSIEAQIIRHSPFGLKIDLRADAGITVLLGPSGAGKTLTLNCIAGFTKPDEGRILVNGQIYFDAVARVNLPPEKRRCGYMFQDQALFPHMTLRGNLRFAAPRKKSGLNIRKRVNELLEAFELLDLADRKPAQLSGGQKQRASLARILIGDPQILLLDEPTRGLDGRLRQAFYEILRDTGRRLNIPMVVVTHDLEECFALADRVCLIDSGTFLQQGPANSVLEKPTSVEAARFLGIYAILPAEIRALDPGRNTSRLRVLQQDIAALYLPGHLIGDRGFLCMRSSELSVHAPGSRPSELVLVRQSAARSPNGVRIVFETGIIVNMSVSDYENVRLLDRLAVHVPPDAVTFVAG
jgi:molybdate transport system ATP-binding protein